LYLFVLPEVLDLHPLLALQPVLLTSLFAPLATRHVTTHREISWYLTSLNVAIKFEKLREMAYIYCTAMQDGSPVSAGVKVVVQMLYIRIVSATNTNIPPLGQATSSLGLTLRRPTIILILVPFLVLPIVFITLAKLREKYLVKEARTRRMVTHFG